MSDSEAVRLWDEYVLNCTMEIGKKRAETRHLHRSDGLNMQKNLKGVLAAALSCIRTATTLGFSLNAAHIFVIKPPSVMYSDWSVRRVVAAVTL